MSLLNWSSNGESGQSGGDDSLGEHDVDEVVKLLLWIEECLLLEVRVRVRCVCVCVCGMKKFGGGRSREFYIRLQHVRLLRQWQDSHGSHGSLVGTAVVCI